jgi:hypothetical protein
MLVHGALFVHAVHCLYVFGQCHWPAPVHLAAQRARVQILVLLDCQSVVLLSNIATSAS